MTFLSIPTPKFIKKLLRKKRHKTYVYDSFIQTHNQAIRLLIQISYNADDISVLRKSTENSFVICKMSKEDLHLLTTARKKFKLCRKYRRRIKLLSF